MRGCGDREERAVRRRGGLREWEEVVYVWRRTGVVWTVIETLRSKVGTESGGE